MEKDLTLREISNKSGYSIATVHRVLRNSPNVTEKTRTKVLEAVSSLTREPVASGDAPSSEKLIGLIIKDIENPFFSRIAKRVEKSLRQRGYTMILFQSNSDQSRELYLSELLVSMDVSGVLITAVSARSPAFESLNQAGIPFMAIDCRAALQDVDWISSDNYRGAYLATDYLIGLGHRHFMYARGEMAQPGLERFEGFKQALKDHNLTVEDQIVLGHEGSEQGGHELIEEYLAEHDRSSLPSAIIAVNDSVAIGVISALRDHGIDVPKDVSVIGYDNIDTGRLLHIPLTTIDQSEFHMGETAAVQLVDKIERPNSADTRKILVRPTLIERASCAKARDKSL